LLVLLLELNNVACEFFYLFYILEPFRLEIFEKVFIGVDKVSDLSFFGGICIEMAILVVLWEITV
jgi:hypothetical protein